MGQRDPGGGELGGDAVGLRPAAWSHDAGVGLVSEGICIYPGCERPVVPAHPLGGPASSFCELEEHNALTAHQERQRLAREAEANDNEEVRGDG